MLRFRAGGIVGLGMIGVLLAAGTGRGEQPAGATPQPLAVARRVADHYAASHKVQLHYADLLTLYGLMRLAEVAERTDYDAFADRALAGLVRGKPPSGLSFENYKMGGIPATYRYVQGRPAGDRALLRKAVDQLIKDHPRDRQGVFCHPREPGEKIWVDCLMAVCPFLSMSAGVLGDARLHDESIAQYVGMERALLDPKLGLFHQVKNFGDPGGISVDTWGRGNGWALIGLAELLRYLPKEHPQRDAMVQRLAALMKALEPLQAPSGRWRQNLVTPDSYEETSGSGLILYALAMGLRKGWLPPTMRPMADRAWAGLAGTVDEGGAVRGTCVSTRGTSRDSLKFYLERPTKTDDIHSFAPVLLAAVEMHLLRAGRAEP